MDEQLQNDIQRVKTYMYQNCVGYKNSLPRREISKALGMEDRYMRMVCAEISECITSSQRGYYILPLVTHDHTEIEVAKSIVEGEERRRLIANYLRQRRQRKAIRALQEKSHLIERQVAFI